MFTKSEQKKLFSWYKENQRPLPWRKTKDPYAIWISETMLQQTTSQAVIPYYHKFLKLFPTYNKLAQANEQDVTAAWAGLGYYSRARNLHKAAKSLNEKKSFPQNFEELIELPGFGPYTARSVASLAFEQNVGVLDGNVIRWLSRRLDWHKEWWKTKERREFQEAADSMVDGQQSSQMNQAMMELGATICLPKNPKCLLCPLMKNCRGRENDNIDLLPLKKIKRATEIYLWKPEIFLYQKKIALTKNDYAPFLKNQWFLPGEIRRLKSRPKTFDFKHAITHHEIFVQANEPTKVRSQKLKNRPTSTEIIWVNPKEIAKWTPASLVKKALSSQLPS